MCAGWSSAGVFGVLFTISKEKCKRTHSPATWLEPGALDTRWLNEPLVCSMQHRGPAEYPACPLP